MVCGKKTLKIFALTDRILVEYLPRDQHIVKSHQIYRYLYVYSIFHASITMKSENRQSTYIPHTYRYIYLETEGNYDVFPLKTKYSQEQSIVENSTRINGQRPRPTRTIIIAEKTDDRQQRVEIQRFLFLIASMYNGRM